MAIGAAVSDGARRFRRIVVVTDVDPPAPPCGACRQALHEFGPEIMVQAVGTGGGREWVLADLLPESFGPEDLNR